MQPNAAHRQPGLRVLPLHTYRDAPTGETPHVALDDHVSKPGADDRLCRFNPPVTQPSPDAHGLWPVVSGLDWCGHFSSTPN